VGAKERVGIMIGATNGEARERHASLMYIQHNNRAATNDLADRA